MVGPRNLSWWAFGLELKIKIILLFNLFLLLFIVSLHFLTIFMGFIVLFQLTFIFIYNTFNNNFLVSIFKKTVLKKLSSFQIL